MAKRISELPAAGTVADADELELNQSGTSRKATRAQIVAGLAAATHGHTLADVTDAGALAAKDIVAEADIANAAVTTAKLADLSVGSAKLALEAVATDRLADAAVTDLKIADGAVTTVKIAPGAVDSGQLADAAATNSKIADGAVTTAKIAANAVDSGQLANAAVVTAKIAAGAVTAAEIAASAVGTTQLANDAVSMAKIAASAVTAAKIAANAVTATQLASNAVIESKIAGNAVTTGKVAANAITATQLASDAVTETKIADNAVTMGKIAANAVGPTQLANTAVAPGVYTVATVTVDQQGRITAASSGVAGEVNAGANAGTDGVGVFAGKVGVDLQFRHIARGSDKVTVTLNGEDIDIDVDEGNFSVPQANVTGLTTALAAKLEALEDDPAPTLADDLNCAGHELSGPVSPFNNATASQAGAPSGRSWKLTGNVTNVPVSNGWYAGYFNKSGSNKTVTPASGVCILTRDGTTQASVTLGNNKRCFVQADGTDLIVDGDVS